MGIHGKARDLRRQDAALSAAGATAWRDARFLLLAGEPGGVAVVPAAGRLRAQDRLHLARELSRPVRAGRLLPRHGDDSDLLGRRRRLVAVDRAHAGRAGRQEHQGRGRLQDAADLALRGGPGDRRRAVALHVPALARAGGAGLALDGRRLEPAARRHPRHDPGHPGLDLEADQLQFPVLPRRPAVDPQSPSSRPPPSTAPGPRGGSGPSSSRCCRRPPSSCWSSTSSTCSSTPSASSTP